MRIFFNVLRRLLGFEPRVHRDLDHLAGRWSEQEYRETTEAVREQRQIDPKMWE